jgi:hypothetical protein
VNDINCYEGVCDSSTGQCHKQQRSGFNKAISTNGVSCLLRYNTAIKAGAIGAGAAVGIAVGAAAAAGLLGWGGKKGWDLYQMHSGLRESAVTNNPLYEQSNMHTDNPLFEAQSESSFSNADI